MARVTVEDSLANCADQFALVHLTALRYRQLHRGAKPLVVSRNKKIVTALREIAASKVLFRDDVQEILMNTRVKLISQRLQNLAQADVVDADELE